jgi:DNA-binding response OmpR family regulator
MDGKILVVDDQKDVADTIYRLLLKNGFVVDRVYSGRDCLRESENGDIKLVFLDIMMPEMSGFEVAEKLRKKYKENIRIVYISIKSRAEINMKYVDGFIQKPFNIKDVVDEANKNISHAG